MPQFIDVSPEMTHRIDWIFSQKKRKKEKKTHIIDYFRENKPPDWLFFRKWTALVTEYFIFPEMTHFIDLLFSWKWPSL